MDLSNHSSNGAKYLDPIIDLGWVEMEHFESPTHPNQIKFTSKLNMQKAWLELASGTTTMEEVQSTCARLSRRFSVGFQRNRSDMAKFDLANGS